MWFSISSPPDKNPVCVRVCQGVCVRVSVCEQTSQMLAHVRPCSSRALCLLGSAQLSLYDCQTTATNASQLLQDARQSFSASIALEGKPASGEPPPGLTGPSVVAYLYMNVFSL